MGVEAQYFLAAHGLFVLMSSSLGAKPDSYNLIAGLNQFGPLW